jgi:hypothetical protein
MRRLCLTLLCCLVAVPAALAAANATGDGVLELSNVTGNVVLAGSRGTVWGQMSTGKLTVTDPVVGDGVIYVSGAESVLPGKTESVTIYQGKDLHFRVTGGRYKLAFKGSGIDLNAVGVGYALLTGEVRAADPGEYAVDNSGKWNPVPVYQTRVNFPSAPPSAPTP